MLTDAELAEIEAKVAASTHLCGDCRMGGVSEEDVKAIFAELAGLRGMRCETCAEWQNPTSDWGGLPAGWGCCLLCEVGSKTYSEELAFPVGAEFNERFLTAPDFGCVRWRAKP
jgi:hypothetical protein